MPPNKVLNLADDSVLETEVMAAAERAQNRGTHCITAFAVLLSCAIRIGRDLAGASLFDLTESVRVMWRETQVLQKDKAS